MIDRSYLPFKAAREYQDRGMMKWMGFFLSEHTASLYDDRNKVDMSSELSNTEKLILIGQLYAAQLEVIFTVRVKKKKVMHIGKVTELSRKEITIKIADTYQLLQIIDILSISISSSIQLPLLSLFRIFKNVDNEPVHAICQNCSN